MGAAVFHRHIVCSQSFGPTEFSETARLSLKPTSFHQQVSFHHIIMKFYMLATIAAFGADAVLGLGVGSPQDRATEEKIRAHGQKVLDGVATMPGSVPGSVRKLTKPNRTLRMGMKKSNGGNGKSGKNGKSTCGGKSGKGKNGDDPFSALDLRTGEDLFLSTPYCPGECFSSDMTNDALIVPCNLASPAQLWDIDAVPGMPGLFTIKSALSGLCIGVDLGTTCASGFGTDEIVGMVPCNTMNAYWAEAQADIIFSWFCFLQGHDKYLDPANDRLCDFVSFADDDGFFDSGFIVFDQCQGEALGF